MRFNLVSFLSEGQPHDEGLDLSENKELIENAARPHFDAIEIYTPRKLNEMGLNNYVRDYKVEGLVTKNPGATRIGNFAWKPKIIAMELDKLENGDMLIYRDSNIVKCGDILGDYNNIRAIAENVLKLCNFDFFAHRESEDYSLKNFTKTNIISELGENSPFVYQYPGVCTNIIIIRKSAVSVQLVKEWNEACEVEHWMDPIQYGNLHPYFISSTGGQSILGVIIANWIRKRIHRIPPNYPVIGFQDRNIQRIVQFQNYAYITLIKETQCFIMTGLWIGQPDTIYMIQRLENGEKVYMIQESNHVKMVSESGVAKYYIGHILQFQPEKWNEYKNVRSNYRLGIF